jgi:hypothetical protein
LLDRRVRTDVAFHLPFPVRSLLLGIVGFLLLLLLLILLLSCELQRQPLLLCQHSEGGQLLHGRPPREAG